MTPSEFAVLRDGVKRDESFSPIPYDDATGKPLKSGDTLKGKVTIGWGTNLSDGGLTRTFAAELLDTRLEIAIAELTTTMPIVSSLDGVRQIVLANMAYNMGVPRLRAFVKMWAAIQAGDFKTAALEMLDSQWSKQVGARATRLASEMDSGELK